MWKLFKYAILGLLMLDVAVLPFGCFGPSNDEGELHIWVEVVETNEWSGIARREFVIYDVEEGYLLTEEDLLDMLSKAIHDKVVKSYEVVKYTLVDGQEIDMPYTVTDEAIAGYHYGVRGAFNINVYIDIELYGEGEANA